MLFLKINKITYLIALAFSLLLASYASFNGGFEFPFKFFVIGALSSSLPVVITGITSHYFLKKTTGFSAIFLFCCFFIIIFLGCLMYTYLFLFPNNSAIGLEFVLVPVSQLTALPFAVLLGVVLKNNAKST